MFGSGLDVGYDFQVGFVRWLARLWGYHASLVQTYPPVSQADKIDIGGPFTCAVLTDGTRSCWGTGWFGSDTTTLSLGPTSISSINRVARVSASNSPACALLEDVTMKCWGSNYNGRLGVGNTYDLPTPTTFVGPIGNVLEMGVGDYHTCARLDNLSVECRGQDGVMLGLDYGDSPAPLG